MKINNIPLFIINILIIQILAANSIDYQKNSLNKIENEIESLEGKLKKQIEVQENANEKESIPRTGLICRPLADCTKILPTNGPVQENETKTSVKAIKKIPRSPPS